MNTDWNGPEGEFETAEKQGELLMLLSRQQVTVHTWDDPDFDYMEEQDLALVVQSPSGTEDLLIELCGEFSVFFEKWHGEYAATAEGYTLSQERLDAVIEVIGDESLVNRMVDDIETEDIIDAWIRTKNMKQNDRKVGQ